MPNTTLAYLVEIPGPIDLSSFSMRNQISIGSLQLLILYNFFLSFILSLLPARIKPQSCCVQKRRSHPFGMTSFGGAYWTRTSGLALLGQVRNSRLLSLPLGTLLCSPRFRFASACGGQPTGLTLISAPHRCAVSTSMGHTGSVSRDSNTKKKRPPFRMTSSFWWCLLDSNQ